MPLTVHKKFLHARTQSLPSKDSVSHLLERQYLIGAYRKRPSHIMRYIRLSSNRTYITALHALPAIGRPSLFTNQTMGYHLPRRTQYVCGPVSLSNQHLFHNPICKTKLLCRSCVWVLSLCLRSLCLDFSEKLPASIFIVKANRMIMQLGCVYIQCECTYVYMYVRMYVRMCPWDTRYEGI
jgi:hypothetical protein